MGKLQRAVKPKEKPSDQPDWWSTDEWETPTAFVEGVQQYLGTFTLDVCARAENAKAPRCYTQADDGLVQPWHGNVWCNMPYSNPGPWAQKAIDEIHRAGERGRGGLSLAMLFPAAIDTGWFQDLVLPTFGIGFLRGRLRFWNWQRKPSGSPTAGNVLAIWPPADQGRFFTLSAATGELLRYL